MDPNSNLTEQLKLASKLQYEIDNDKPYDEHEVLRLTELVIALDGWLSNGGFKPRKWRGRR